MASKIIFDHPELLLENSQFLNLTEATKRFPTKPSRATVERFVRTGIRGVKLATVMIGGRRYTTENAIREFLVGQQHTKPEHVQTELNRRNLTQTDIAAATRKYGLPEPQEVSTK